MAPSQVIAGPTDTIGDLLTLGTLDLGPGKPAEGGAAGGNIDLLSGGGGDILGADPISGVTAPPSTNALLGDIFGLGNAASTTFYIPPKQEWLNAAKGKHFDITPSIKAMQPLSFRF